MCTCSQYEPPFGMEYINRAPGGNKLQPCIVFPSYNLICCGRPHHLLLHRAHRTYWWSSISIRTLASIRPIQSNNQQQEARSAIDRRGRRLISINLCCVSNNINHRQQLGAPSWAVVHRSQSLYLSICGGVQFRPAKDWRTCDGVQSIA